MLQHTMAYVKNLLRAGDRRCWTLMCRIGTIPCIRFADALAVENALGGGKNRARPAGRSAAVRVLRERAGQIRVRDAFSHGQTSVLCDGATRTT